MAPHQVVPERHLMEIARSTPRRRRPVFQLCAVAAISIGAALRGPFYGFFPALLLAMLAGCAEETLPEWQWHTETSL